MKKSKNKHGADRRFMKAASKGAIAPQKGKGKGTFTPKQLTEALAKVCASERATRTKKKDVAQKVWKDIKMQDHGAVPPSEERSFAYYLEHSRGRYCDGTKLTESTEADEFLCRDGCTADILCWFYTFRPNDNQCQTFQDCAVERGGNNPFAVTMAKFAVPEETAKQTYYDLFPR